MYAELYSEARADLWNEFVRKSKNGTFLFLRDYMDYHRDRIRDHSLLIWDDGELMAILPGNTEGDTLASHGGLTYGGLLTDKSVRLPEMAEIFLVVTRELASRGFKKLLYKTVPHIYHQVPAEEDRYWLFRNRAVLYRSDVLTVIDYRERLKYQERRTRSLNRARKYSLDVRRTQDYRVFWELLTINLETRYGLKPVHTIDEIRSLAARFPENIQLYGAYEGDQMEAGAVVYLGPNVCHVQYNAASSRGKERGAQDILMDYLVELHSRSHRYFDFGVSTENQGQHLSDGLVAYKESFGGRTIVHNFFVMELQSI